MDEQINVMYDRVTASGLVSRRPALLDAVIAANRHFLVTLPVGVHNGDELGRNFRVPARCAVGGSMAVIFEHPVALDNGIYIDLSLAGSVEVTVGYRIW